MILRDIAYNLLQMSMLWMLSLGFASCADDDLSEVPNVDPFDPDGFSLGITISLEGDLQSRADSEYDNYIDTRNRFRVLFFDENGQFIFEAIDRTVMPRTSGSGNPEWFVHIPVNYIIDYEGNVYDVEALKTQLKEHDFKVAILANWTYREAASGNEISDKSRAEPLWGYYNSILCPDTESKKSLRNINDLHHLAHDTNYDKTGDPAPADVYGFMWGTDTNKATKLGVKTQWVESRSPEKDITSRETAEEWIRENWDPTRENTDKNYPPYDDLWLLWNFDGAYSKNNDGVTPKDTYTGKYAAEWFSRNYKDFEDWLYYGELKEDFYILDDQGKPKDGGNLFFLGGGGAYYYDKDGRGGIVLPAISNTLTDDGLKYKDENANKKNVIKFRYPASGSLYVKWGSYDGSDAKITIEKRNEIDQGLYMENKNPNATRLAMADTYTWPLNVTEDSQYISIYCTRGNAIIYEIEYIANKYLYDTDRQGILPSEDHPIPMYGVQNFKKLEGWEPGTTFDISYPRDNHSDYEAKSISLIRSVAKVVVYLPTWNGKAPAQVYMRSMNRTSRCEPMDVETPTNELWRNHVSGSNDTYNPDFEYTPSSKVCEWHAIQAYGSFFQGTASDKSDDVGTNTVQTYQNRLSWFFGSWKNAKWANGQGWSFGNLTVPNENSYAYPHLFNTSIDRSDFTEMRKVESDDSRYYKYVLYMPDKNIDDPNTVGVSQSLTKVAHVEYRYDNTLNLDDNSCFRIYFTDYKSNPNIGSVDKASFDNKYEVNSTNLGYHWPIMRNHVYTFVVGGTLSRSGEDGAMPEVTSTVTTWSGEPLLE